jgi:hypothetical protein
MTEFRVIFSLEGDDVYPLIDLSSTCAEDSNDSSDASMFSSSCESVESLICDDKLKPAEGGDEICNDKEREGKKPKRQKLERRMVKMKELTGSVVVFNRREYEEVTDMSMPF